MKKINCDFSGQNNGNVKLTDKEIKELRKDWTTGQWTLRSLATRYGISHGHVHKIIKGKTRQQA